jgi:hypothetical protein
MTISLEDISRIEYWITALTEMHQQHMADLDHKDCAELSEYLQALLEEVRA